MNACIHIALWSVATAIGFGAIFLLCSFAAYTLSAAEWPAGVRVVGAAASAWWLYVVTVATMKTWLKTRGVEIG